MGIRYVREKQGSECSQEMLFRNYIVPKPDARTLLNVIYKHFAPET